MIAKMKCSNCGAEMSNLNMSWGRRYWLFVIPVMLLGFLPLLKMTFFKGDVTKDLSISEIQKRAVDKSIEIIGLLTNNGSRKWSSVTVEVDFFDASGVFIDEASEYLRSEVAAGAKEHFKIAIRSPGAAILAPDTKMVVKVSGGHTMPF